MAPIVKIHFDQNDGVYFSGQVVSGKVEISLLKAKKVQGIAIQISGYARANWNDRHDRHRRRQGRRRRARYSGREEYLSATTYVLGSPNGMLMDMLPGFYTYTFTTALPPFTPSSFEGSYGHIRYVAKVIFDRSRKSNQTYTVGFTVLRSVDLNYDSPLLRNPAEVETIKTFWFGLFSSKPLFLKVRLPQTGFVPGQIIPIQTEINNTSTSNVSAVLFYLRKIITYRTDLSINNKKDEIVNLVCKTSGYVTHASCSKFQEDIIIPAVPPTSLMHSKIIQINYDIKVQAVIGGIHIDPYVTCPITIGTVPLMGIPLVPVATNQFTEPQPSTSHYPREGAPTSLPIIVPTTQSSNIPPPSYEESVGMARAQVDEDDEYSIQRNDFLPRYPVYRFENSKDSKEYKMAEDMHKG